MSIGARPIGLLVVLTAALNNSIAIAGDTSGSEWKFSATPYLWAPSISSDAEIRGIATGGDVNAGSSTDFGDILKDTDFGFLGHIEAQNGPYALFGDIVYLRISSDADTDAFSVGAIGVSPLEIDIDLEGTILELGSAYKFWQGRIGDLSPDRLANAEIIGGLRYTRLDFDSTLKTTFSGPRGTFSRQVSTALGFTIELYDPIVGARAFVPLGDDWTLKLRGDVGGFGVDSDLTWSAGIGATYQAWEQTSLLFGYRALGYHLEADKPGTSTKLELILHGPVIAVTFSW